MTQNSKQSAKSTTQLKPNLYVQYQHPDGRLEWLLCHDELEVRVDGYARRPYVYRPCAVGVPTREWLDNHAQDMGQEEYKAWLNTLALNGLPTAQRPHGAEGV